MALSSLIRIATRRSALALAQTELVKNALLAQFPELEIELVPLVTEGDQRLETPLAEIGGKGLFIKELERALITKEADLAVHSLKDLPAQCAPELEIIAVLERDDPRDALISPKFNSPKAFTAGTKIGTASLRRKTILENAYPEIKILPLRGNVNTRLAKLEAGEFDALILAAAGLQRLDLEEKIQYYFSPKESLPAIGQGIIAIQCHPKHRQLVKYLKAINHSPTWTCTKAERSLNAALGASCHAPVAGYATLTDANVHLRGQVWALDGSQIYFAEGKAPAKEARLLGRQVAEQLLAQGAGQWLS